MDINNTDHIFTCYVVVSPFCGIRYVEIVAQGEQVDEPEPNDLKYKIALSDGFMEHRCKPMFEYVAEKYTYDTAEMLMVVLLQYGLQQGANNYETILHHKANNTMHEFATEFVLHDNEDLDNFMQIYYDLKDAFAHEQVDEFLVDMLLYGASTIKDLPEEYVFGPVGYAAKN